MSAVIKTPEEIEKMRVAGRLAAEVLEMIEPHVVPGVTTDELNTICHDYIVNVQDAIPAPLNYHGFPKSICTSVNHVICHGIPNDKPLKEGDSVNIDVTVIKDGYHGDTSKMFHVGTPNIQGKRLADITQESLYLAIKMVKPGVRLGDIGAAIQKYAESFNYSIVREYCGHGIGAEFHEEPQVMHYGKAGTGEVLKAGMCLTIEPMVNAGKRQCKLLKDNWTVVTKDRSLSAQWEHTLLVTENGVEILTLRSDDTIDRIIEHQEPAPVALPNKVKKLLSQAEQLSDYRDCSSYFYKWLQNEFSKQPVSNLINARAEFIDRLLIKLFHDYDLAHESDLALIAVGGYGRGELHPYSDIDFMLLVSEQPSEAVCEKIGQFVTMLWDLNLEIGHSVRTIEQALEQKREDVTFATSLLESRLIFGNHIEFEKLKNHLIDTPIWRSDEFFLAKVQEQSLRHKKCHGTAYNLEPNIKENPGGLRDLQTIIWVAKKHFRAETLQELINHGYLTHEEYQELSECLENLWNIRFALHIAAGRSENRLLFDHQPHAAEILGFGSEGKASVERMMKRLFRIMSRVRELNQMLLSYFEQSILPGAGELPVVELDRNFERIGHQIRVKNPSVFFRRDQLFVLFEHIADNPEITHIYPSTIRTMRQVRRRLLGDLQDYAACREAFLRLIKHPNGMGRAFTLMHKHGIIAAYLPQWRNIFGQMQFDLFHAYTVDEHTHKLINNIYKYFDKSKVSEFPLCSEIVTRMDKPELLYLAGIFHDIAKGRGGDHSELGSVDAIAFAKLHRFPSSDGKLISWLVANHLLMSVTAQRKDINDPDVIKDFASKVKNERQLDYLYCLTLADIRATNDNLWNDWKNTLLRELYLHTQRALRLGLENPMDQRDQIRDKKQQAKQRLLNHGCNEDQIDLIWSRFKANYFTAFSEQQISWQTEHLLNCEDLSLPSVTVSDTAMHGGTQVFAYSPYSGGLFARLVSVIGSKKAQIQHAQVLTTKDGYVIFSFVILEVNGDPIASSRAQGIKRALELAISDPKKKIRIKKNRSQRFKDFNIKPKIVLRPHARKDRSLIEIQAVDIPGLLTKIAEVFQAHLLHIHAARITTVGERAEDFFVVSNNEYQALTDEEQAKIHQALRKKLNAETE